MTDLTTEPAEQTVPERAGRAWWQRLPFLLVVGVLPVPLGMYFVAFIAMAVLLSDRTRDTPVRAAGAVGLFWWAYSFREGDTTPYFAAPVLVLAAALFAQSALVRRREAGWGPWWVPGVAAVGALALALVSFFPDGYRKPELDREAAARAVFAERADNPWREIKPTSYLVERGRARLVHTPLWFVVLYENHPTVKRTVDDQPCFLRRQVWKVNALDGAVTPVTYDESRVGGDPCLPIRLGTEEDLRPVLA